MAIATINSWNRIAGALRFAPPILGAAGEHDRDVTIVPPDLRFVEEPKSAAATS